LCLRFKSIDKVNHTRQVSGRLLSYGYLPSIGFLIHTSELLD